MSMFDIKAVKQAAEKEMMEEQMRKAKDALTKQMRVVVLARQTLRAEEMKLHDIEQQIEDGTL